MSRSPEEIRKRYETTTGLKDQAILQKVIVITDRLLEQKGEDLIRNGEIILHISSIEHSFTNKMMEEMGVESFDQILQIIKNEYRGKWKVIEKNVAKSYKTQYGSALCFSEKKAFLK